jgi:hypothetical protein
VSCTDVFCAPIYNNGIRFWIIFWISANLDFDMNFHPNRFLGVDLSFKFGLWVSVRDTTSDTIATKTMHCYFYYVLCSVLCCPAVFGCRGNISTLPFK